MEELYKQYGELMVQAEVLQAQINEVKSKIAQQLNAPKDEPVEPEKK